MPSEDLTREALEALASAREAFSSAVVAAAESVRALLTAGAGTNGHVERAARELGPFGAGRIDTQRFAALFAGKGVLDPAALKTLGRAQAVLAEIAAAPDELFLAEVPSGGALRPVIEAALGRAGRAFGAAHVAERVRSGRYHAKEHDAFLEAYPPARWNRAERQIAPPLVVLADGAALATVGGLADLLQGCQKLLLIVRGASAPAPLVRLLTPGVFVQQAGAVSALDRFAAVDGPAVAALLPAGTATFVHEPAGASLAERLTVSFAPAEATPAGLPAYTQFQQAEELQQLTALAAEAVRPAPAGVAEVAGPATPADKLAAWLLRQAHLGDA